MTDYRAIEQRVRERLGLQRRPVAVAFLDAPPDGVTKFTGSAPSRCSFWRLAMDGRAFYTGAGDGELYVAVPGREVARVADEIATIAQANATLADYHRGRRTALASE